VIDLIGRYAEAGLHHLVGPPPLHPVRAAPGDPHGQLRATLDELRRFAADVLPYVQ